MQRHEERRYNSISLHEFQLLRQGDRKLKKSKKSKKGRFIESFKAGIKTL